MLEKFAQIEKRFLELETLLSQQEIIADKAQYQKLAKEYADLTLRVNIYRAYQSVVRQKEDLEKLLEDKHDKEFEALARAEKEDLKKKQEELFRQMDDLLNPQTQDDNKNLIIEIRAGTGGEEASLFAGDLYRMYVKYADRQGWKVEVMSSNASGTGGFKEVIFSIKGKGAAKRLKWESGAHRVQRVPSTEASGRIHTSAATVAVLFEPEEVEVKIDPSDLIIDVYRSSGPGGQSVNTTESAIRLTHKPTGIVVTCQDERSQLKNRLKAMRVLRARLLDHQIQQNFEKTSQDRKAKIGTGDRSEKIRTYNFSDRRVTDHRIGFTSHQLINILDGNLDELTEALIQAEKQEALK
ncbi:MAG: peptide chain release factor 1 [Candidatus Omnitrophota bacterium]|nr:peptide chain release factor 1 [Candidatus Omnitrophota bacterium]